MPKVSVVVPLYNKAPHIHRTLDSVLGQTYTDFEIVVVDDGSTDGGSEIVKAFNDNRIRLIKQLNAGVSVARNAGVKQSLAELVAFLDADDEWHPDFLETVISLRDRFPDAGLYGTSFNRCTDGRIIKGNSDPINADFKDGLLDNYFKYVMCNGAPFYSSSVMIPKAVLEGIGGFPVGVKTGEDQYTWIRIALEHPIAWSTKECAVYHLDSVNRAAGTEAPCDLPFAKVIEDACANTNGVSEEVCFYAYEYLCRMRITLARKHIMANRISIAKELLDKSVNTELHRPYRRKMLMLLRLPSPILQMLRLYKRHR